LQQPVGHKLDVLLHEVAVHAYQVAGQCFREELLLNLHSVSDDDVDTFFGRLVSQVTVHQACKVTVQTLKKHKAQRFSLKNPQAQLGERLLQENL
jgi:hypothetical protein